MHAHQDNIEILLIIEGKGDFFIGHKHYTVQKGDLVIYEAGVIHDELFRKVKEPLAWYCLGIKYPEKRLIAENEVPVIPSKGLFSVLMAGCSLLFELATEPKTNPSDSLDHVFYAIWEIVAAQVIPYRDIVFESKRLSEPILEIKAHLEDSFANQITLDSLEQRWPISKFHLSHKFKEYYGYTPMDYLKLRRIGEAQTLLIWTQKPIIEVAHEVGFNSDSYFTTAFKQLVSITPTEYRKYFV